MSRKITIYETSLQGYGCFKREIEVDASTVVSETLDEITLRIPKHEDEGDLVYCKTIDRFIKSETEYFLRSLRELTERHQHTIAMANEQKG